LVTVPVMVLAKAVAVRSAAERAGRRMRVVRVRIGTG